MVHSDDESNGSDDELDGSAFDDSPDVSFSEPEPIDSDDGSDGSSGGSSSDSDSGDNSTVVTVVGDPGSKEGLTTVGRGDTIEESERDAATNPNFDADEGTDIDDIEEDLGTDQPEINPDDSASDSRSVVVTENQQGEQETVSVAQTQTGAKVQAAADQSFDAAIHGKASEI